MPDSLPRVPTFTASSGLFAERRIDRHRPSRNHRPHRSVVSCLSGCGCRPTIFGDLPSYCGAPVRAVRREVQITLSGNHNNSSRSGTPSVLSRLASKLFEFDPDAGA